MMRNTGFVTIWVALSACTGQISATPEQQKAEQPITIAPQALIYDQTHNAGTPGFFFYPPIAQRVTTNGTFEARIEPKVRIDRIDGTGKTLQTLVTFNSRWRVDGEKVRRHPRRGFYIARWHTDRYDLRASAQYRIRILVADRELGFADVEVKTRSREFRHANQDFVPLRKGTTLPIVFRIETQAVDRDGDGVFDWLDNCPIVSNPPVYASQDTYTSGGRAPRGCDYEAEECDPEEVDAVAATFTQTDTDLDGIGDACKCDKGHSGGGSSPCADIDECAGATPACDILTTCTNTQGGFTCGPCPSGYSGTGLSGCVDLDECALGTDDCSELATCGNLEGGFQCSACPAGYQADGHDCVDIDECATAHGGCDAKVECTNTDGSYSCGDCPEGYTGGGASGCVDIDECAGPTPACDPLTTCTNSDGGVACGDCPEGYRGDGVSGCMDIDECAEQLDTCSELVTCGNTAGGYECGACPAGYAGDGHGCADIDECAVGNGGCSALVACQNSPGSHSCGACPAGYLGDGFDCTDIDECEAEPAPCDGLTDCTNLPGSFECGACPEGYVGSGAAGCFDVDECAQDLDTCSPLVSCANTAGGYACGACPAGYEGDGHTCTDLDECASETDACDPLVSCTNTPGGYSCGDCPPGYEGGGLDGCADIDECEASPAPCDSLTTCTNTEGAFECGACPTGYSGSGYDSCLDIDECLVDHGGCDPLTACINEVGGRSCGPCPVAYVGDGEEGCEPQTEFNCFTPELLASFYSDDEVQCASGFLNGWNMDTPPGQWRVRDCALDPPQGSTLNNRYHPMFEQLIDRRDLRNVRIEMTVYTGNGSGFTHPGIMFRANGDDYAWLYIRPHQSGTLDAVALSSSVDGFFGFGIGPQIDGIAGVVDDVGYDRMVDLVLELVDDKLSLDINGVRRVTDFDISTLGFAPSGQAGVATGDNRDTGMAFLRFKVTALP